MQSANLLLIMTLVKYSKQKIPQAQLEILARGNSGEIIPSNKVSRLCFCSFLHEINLIFKLSIKWKLLN